MIMSNWLCSLLVFDISKNSAVNTMVVAKNRGESWEINSLQHRDSEVNVTSWNDISENGSIWVQAKLITGMFKRIKEMNVSSMCVRGWNWSKPWWIWNYSTLKLEYPVNHWKSKKCRQNYLLEKVRIQIICVQVPVMRVEREKMNEVPNETIFHQMLHEWIWRDNIRKSCTL